MCVVLANVSSAFLYRYLLSRLGTRSVCILSSGFKIVVDIAMKQVHLVCPLVCHLSLSSRVIPAIDRINADADPKLHRPTSQPRIIMPLLVSQAFSDMQNALRSGLSVPHFEVGAYQRVRGATSAAKLSHDEATQDFFARVGRTEDSWLQV